jgi:nudix-type nucleoside diphosphatase (YffH/AdpP family)
MAETRLPDGETVSRAVLEHGDAAAVLAYDRESRTALLVRQYRVPMLYVGSQEALLEAVAGRVENEEPACAAKREFLEEAGFQLGELEPVATCWSSPGVTTERIVLYLAPYRRESGISAGGRAAGEHEELEVEELRLSALAEMADRGQLQDMKTLVLLQTLRLRYADLFR